MHDGVALDEGSASGVLTDQSNRCSLQEQRSQSKELTKAPVDIPSAAHFVAFGKQ
ncbi:MAG: Uncharacterised protein [Cellulomonadaceae bacterium TMED98]|nr:MAG: Uncharacterised protein [Cellulomonadaceae bacterium TMED98]